MIKKLNRFHGYGSLKYVYKNGKPIRSRLLTVKSVVNKRRSDPRFSVVVSKKILKSAVGRNRIRRRVYEIIRHELPTIKNNYDVVVIITSQDVRTIEHNELKRTIVKSFQESNIYI